MTKKQSHKLVCCTPLWHCVSIPDVAPRIVKVLRVFGAAFINHGNWESHKFEKSSAREFIEQTFSHDISEVKISLVEFEIILQSL